MWRRSRLAVPLSAAALAVFQVGGSFGASANQPDRRALDALAIALLLLGPAALAVRDRWPVVAAAVAVGAADLYINRGYAYGPIFLGAGVGLVHAAMSGHRREAWAIGVLGAVLLDRDLLHLAAVAGWLAVLFAVTEVVRSRRAHHEEDRRRRAGEQRLRLAQDLHDVLAHNISLINVQAGVALHLLDDHPEQARPALSAIKDASGTALHELRAALDLLRSGDPGAAPRSPAPTLRQLPDLVEGVRASGLDVDFAETGRPRPHPEATELAAYRIVQEALTNVTRHARARRATVRVDHGDDLVVEVEDDGVGGAAPPGNGIAGMRERAASLGGEVDAGPRPGGRGFRVVARLPA